ncbi:MAG: helix-turn-helix transcriptional regulator [Vicingaceae bacterium]|nr:helix-turn-helix transcriptional regulator [Vicingaceae bacterium]
MTTISTFIKYHRKKLRLTQKEFADKAGVGLRFIRELEQGKQTMQLDKVNQVLSLVGFEIFPQKIGIDPYLIFWDYLNKAVIIRLKNKISKPGIIIKEILDIEKNTITAWKFISNNNAIQFQQTQNKELIEVINHSDIQEINLQ